MGIAAEIRAEMGRQRVTTTALARLTGIARPNLSRKLAEKRPLSLHDVERIAHALNVNLSDLAARAEQSDRVFARAMVTNRHRGSLAAEVAALREVVVHPDALHRNALGDLREHGDGLPEGVELGAQGHQLTATPGNGSGLLGLHDPLLELQPVLDGVDGGDDLAHGSSPSVAGGGAATPVPGEATVGDGGGPQAGSFSPVCDRTRRGAASTAGAADETDPAVRPDALAAATGQEVA